MLCWHTLIVTQIATLYVTLLHYSNDNLSTAIFLQFSTNQGSSKSNISRGKISYFYLKATVKCIYMLKYESFGPKLNYYHKGWDRRHQFLKT